MRGLRQQVLRDGAALSDAWVVLVCLPSAGRAQRFPGPLRALCTDHG